MKGSDRVVDAVLVDARNHIPEWLYEVFTSQDAYWAPMCADYVLGIRLPKKGFTSVNAGEWITQDVITKELGVWPDIRFKALFVSVEEPEEPEHKNYTAMRLRKLAKSDVHAWIDGIDVLTLAKEAADEIDWLVSLVWAESKRASKAEDKSWDDQKKIARLEEIIRDETKRADAAEIELGRANYENRRIQPKKCSANEVFAWAYKKMQEEENNG